MHHSFAVTYAHLSLESLLFPCFQAFFIFKFRHILLAFCIVLWCNKYYTKRSACYVPQKTPNLNGRIRLSIVDTYYDEVLKDIGRVTDIDFGKRIRTLGEIKKVLAKTKK